MHHMWQQERFMGLCPCAPCSTGTAAPSCCVHICPRHCSPLLSYYLTLCCPEPSCAPRALLCFLGPSRVCLWVHWWTLTNELPLPELHCALGTPTHNRTDQDPVGYTQQAQHTLCLRCLSPNPLQSSPTPAQAIHEVVFVICHHPWTLRLENDMYDKAQCIGKNQTAKWRRQQHNT
jgi:hypothetical protein